jgi:hypothetical protein
MTMVPLRGLCLPLGDDGQRDVTDHGPLFSPPEAPGIKCYHWPTEKARLKRQFKLQIDF